ncbi:hypothetical protein EMIT0111MI5_20408 [Burkholderia sp. IT-111MI5]
MILFLRSGDRGCDLAASARAGAPQHP